MLDMNPLSTCHIISTEIFYSSPVRSIASVIKSIPALHSSSARLPPRLSLQVLGAPRRKWKAISSCSSLDTLRKCVATPAFGTRIPSTVGDFVVYERGFPRMLHHQASSLCLGHAKNFGPISHTVSSRWLHAASIGCYNMCS